jgi:O-antigen/teichoic acid export membrane protein
MSFRRTRSDSTAANIRFNLIARAAVMLVQLGVTTILARTLSPHDYGVVGVAMILIGFLGRFDDFGMTAALVQRPALDVRSLATAQSLNAAIAVVLFLLAQAAAPFTADIFKNDAVPWVVRILGCTFLLSPVRLLPTALLTREMRFASLRGPAVAGALARGLVAVGLALIGARYWSLVVGMLAGAVTTALLLRVSFPVRAPWVLDRGIARELLHYGLPLSGSMLLMFIVYNTDNFFIGTLRSTNELGFYAVAINWSTFVCSTLSEVVQSVLFPRFSQLQSDRRELAIKYARSLRATAFVALLCNGALFACADGFLYTVLGGGTSRWMPSLLPLQILCVYGAVRAILDPAWSVIMAVGCSRLLLWANSLPAIIELSLMPFVVAKWGLPGAAVLMTTALNVQWLVYGRFLRRELAFAPTNILLTVLPSILAAVTAVAAARSIPLGSSLLWPGIILRGVVVCVAFSAVHELLSRGAMTVEICRAVGLARRPA